MNARTFVVDGGTSGLGLEAARILAADHRVVILGNVPDEVSRARNDLGCDGLVCDISRADQVHDALTEVVERYGPIDGLAHCAAMWAGGRLEDLSPEMIRRAVEVNVLGTAILLHEVLIRMREQGYGNVVYVSALATEVPRPGIPLYRATKSFGTSLVESLAEAQGTNSIKVMEIRPGPMHTRLQERVGAEFLDTVFAAPEQVAAEVVRLLLLTPDDLYVSGQKVLRADGRW
ncbi:SDR family oxidoreductase [Micromonospora sp. HM5-17]|jgi:NAD(P)-dependent dehydrogenase (short-subunit alcohol dehydrogenase family)|uniref:SDR family NAD(P)-dependent oxidoreductase n=1 Tax=Micromonospora sp. HM5-17 TaxID=2487710 RepID=UPI000F484588|nr:SDR family oxidoreductase [Micromonospora sp. HM5-17]ROT27125.1 SDR family oxidoreductase [Micromonospora sp. HM5-17]